MPYFPGLDFVDSINQAITDSVNTAVAEASESITGLIDKITVAVNNTIQIKSATGTTPDTLPDVKVYLETGIPWLKTLDVSVTHTPSGTADLGPAIIGLLNYYGAELLAALTAEGGGNVVNLPATPPTGYGGADANSTASAVWAFQLLNPLEETRTADSALTECMAFADAWQRVGTIPIWGTAHFVAFTNRAWLYHWSTSITPPNPDYSDIQSDDTVLSWLTRTETTRTTWLQDASTGLCYTNDVLESEYQDQIWCTLTTPELLKIGGFGGVVASVGAPVWPGAANVTLGTPVSIANGASSSEACDGVIVAITAVPSDQGSYQFGTDHSYVHLGQLAFIDDSGDYEDGQNFGFAAGIITPKRMAHAAGFTMRVKSGVSGTVTPWVNA